MNMGTTNSTTRDTIDGEKMWTATTDTIITGNENNSHVVENNAVNLSHEVNVNVKNIKHGRTEAKKVWAYTIQNEK